MTVIDDRVIGDRKIDDWVIDVDAHITEPADVWQDRVPARYRDAAPRLVRDPDTGKDTWIVGGGTPLVGVGHSAVAGWPEPFPAAPRNMDEVPRAAWDPEARLDYMDSVGIWAQVMYPNVGGFGNQGFLSLGDTDLMLACVRAYNDWLTDWCSTDSSRLLPVTATPFWDVDACVEEIERCAALGHRGVLFTGEPQHFGLPYLGDHHWDRFYAAAQDAQLPISFHIGSGDFESGFTPDRIRAHGIAPTYAATSVTLFLDNGAQIVDLLLSGVLARFPELRFISVESGIGFLPFLLEAADYAFEQAAARRERPELELLPSDYFRRQVYGCWFFEERAPRRVVDEIGADNLCFETDYPHPICLYGNVREKIDAAVGGEDAEVRRKLLWANAARLYRVEEPQPAR
jgi:predicted TIM-barrel fold metal-dependent hydrolase